MNFRFYLNSLSFTPILLTTNCRSRLSCVSLTLDLSQLSSWVKLRDGGHLDREDDILERSVSGERLQLAQCSAHTEQGARSFFQELGRL